MSRVFSAPLIGLVVCSACGHARTPLPTTVAVFPLDRVELPDQSAKRIRQAITRQAANLGVPPVKVDRVDRVAQSLPGCRNPARESWVRCSVKVGEQVNASHVVVGAAGGLGSTYVLQLQLIGIKERTVTRAVEETVFGKPSKLESIVPRITARLFDIPPPRRWYEHWWVWTIAGAAAVATAIAIPLAVLNKDSIETHRFP